MSEFTLDTAMEMFSTEFQLQYQAAEILQNTTMERHGTQGTSLNVPVIDKIEMSEMGFAPSNIPVTNVSKRNVVCEQQEYTLKTVVGRGEKTLFAYDELKAYAAAHAKACARFADYLKIQAFTSYATPNDFVTVAKTVGTRTGMNEAKLAQALSGLEANGVDVMNLQCSMWLPAIAMANFYSDDRVVNFFYNDDKPLSNNYFPSYLGTSIRKLPDAVGGINTLPFTGSSPRNYYVPVVHKDAMIISFNIDPNTTIVWVPQEQRWEAVSILVAGAVVVQPEGIARINIDYPDAAN